VHQKHFASLTALTFAAGAIFIAGNGARGNSRVRRLPHQLVF